MPNICLFKAFVYDIINLEVVNTSLKREIVMANKSKSIENIDKKLLKEQKANLKDQKRRESQEKKSRTKEQKLEMKRLKKAQRKQRKQEHFKEKVKKNLHSDWFKLDNAAIIYPSIKEENWTFVFRISAVLKESVKPELLQQSVCDTMPRFPTFNVGLKQGIFWNYFEEKATFPKVKKESKFPCHNFDIFSSKEHIVRVLYYNNRISVECFHGIADGRSAMKFFNSLLRRYFILSGTKIESEEGCLSTLDKPRKEEAEDAFAIYSTKGKKSAHGEEKAFRLTGTEEEFGVVNATMGTMSVAKVKEIAKNNNCSLTEFLVSTLAFCIWKKNKNHKRPIKISVPIDLRAYFETETLRNFSGYINVAIPQKNGDYTLEEIIEIVKQELKRVDKEYLTAFINSNVAMQKNFFIKLVPLFLKNFFIKMFFKAWGEAYQTINVSNLGKVAVPPEFEEKVEKYTVNLGRPKYNSKTVGLVSFGDKLVWTFSSKVKECDLEQVFFSELSKMGIEILIESNRRDLYA